MPRVFLGSLPLVFLAFFASAVSAQDGLPPAQNEEEQPVEEEEQPAEEEEQPAEVAQPVKVQPKVEEEEPEEVEAEEDVAEEDANTKARKNVLILPVKNNGVDANAVATMGNLLAVELSRIKEIDVISGDDIRRMAELEADRMNMGCDKESCLAEIADAMGASLVVFGTAGRIGRISVFNLNLFDASASKSLSRIAVRTDSLEELPDRLTIEIGTFIRPLISDETWAVVESEFATRAEEAKARLIARQATRRGEDGSGMLVVRTNPSGASVFVDGRNAGTSPLTIEQLSSGLHEIEARLGGLNGKQHIDVRVGGVARVKLRLQATPVSVTIVSSPPDARIFIDGIDMGLAPMVLQNVASGTRVFLATLDGHSKVSRPVRLDLKKWQDGKQVPLRVEFNLLSNADDVTACSAGEPRKTCGQIATEAWEAKGDDRDVAMKIWGRLCDAGNGNVCAFIATQLRREYPKRARERALQACRGHYPLGCRFFVSLKNWNTELAVELARDIKSESASFLSGSANYHYDVGTAGSCKTNAECRILCDLKLDFGCRALIPFIEAERQPKASFDERKALEQHRLDVLNSVCDLSGSKKDCKYFRNSLAAFDHEFGGMTLKRVGFSPLVGVVPFLGTSIGIGAGGLLGAFGGALFAQYLGSGTVNTGILTFTVGPPLGMALGLVLMTILPTLLATWTVASFGKAALAGGAAAITAGAAVAVVSAGWFLAAGGNPDFTRAVPGRMQLINTIFFPAAASALVAASVTSGLATAILVPFLVDGEPTYE